MIVSRTTAFTGGVPGLVPRFPSAPEPHQRDDEPCLLHMHVVSSVCMLSKAAVKQMTSVATISPTAVAHTRAFLDATLLGKLSAQLLFLCELWPRADSQLSPALCCCVALFISSLPFMPPPKTHTHAHRFRHQKFDEAHPIRFN